MPRKVFITGIGVISAIGCGAEENLRSLQASISGIGGFTPLNSVHNNIPVAAVKKDTSELIKIAEIRSNPDQYSRTTLLGLIAAKQAFKANNDKSVRTGFISATTVGGMDITERYYNELLHNDKHKSIVDVLDCADSAEKIAMHLGIKEHITTISTACSSSANSIMFGARLIRNNLLDRVLVGGTDSLSKFTLNGFNALEILSPTGAMPFDENRNGLTIGEAAAYLMLEAEEIAEPQTIFCQVSGFANSNEAFHATASSEDGMGASMAMKKALAVSGLLPENIDYINAHGTGTLINDLSEGRAIETVFASKIPLVSSTKGFTGHTLGAAGAIEAVFSVLAIKHQLAFPNLNFQQKMESLSFTPQQKCIHADINNVMSNSFGFGGSNTSLIFSKV